jgi:ParB family chromosome partitioning protein
MATKRQSLSRGLGALLGQPTSGTTLATGAAAPVAVPAAAPAAPVDEVLQKLPIDLLQRGKYQPRIDMRQETLQELADSIKAQGVVQPIVVRPIGKTGERRYEIIAGERRWRASQLAGLHEIPAVIRLVDDEHAIAMALIENIQRENLNPLEEARSLERLIDEFQMTHAAAAQAVGRSRAAVSNLLRLLDLGEDARALVERRELDMGHARALLALPDRRQQAQAAAQIVRESLSVRDTEALVKRLSQPAPAAAPATRADPNIRKLEADLSEKLGAKVQVQHMASGKGRLIISYHTLDELDGILEHIH